ncbi:hypothetical protein QVD17_41425 [Tagetes erecta]|uniref:Uncharacterized protein n=1 Tax=Tagetes erecta TaxID=13708 RepID=A0AAD8JMP1_TARER|nr:hypothetical protein QVD17_41425 [Tagetes erecta]
MYKLCCLLLLKTLNPYESRSHLNKNLHLPPPFSNPNCWPKFDYFFAGFHMDFVFFVLPVIELNIVEWEMVGYVILVPIIIAVVIYDKELLSVLFFDGRDRWANSLKFGCCKWKGRRFKRMCKDKASTIAHQQARELLDHLENVLANEPVAVNRGQYIVAYCRSATVAGYNAAAVLFFYRYADMKLYIVDLLL